MLGEAMANDFEASHEAMLFFMEILMNSNDPLTISQLAGRFGSKQFTQEMRQAAGGNEEGLKKFLQKYPSLFKVTSNMVSINNDLGLSEPSSPKPSHKRSKSLGGSSDTDGKVRSLPDVSTEMDAVKFFQERLERRDEKWVLIKSLAGHLSQASQEIRQCVGPQTEFKRFLVKHPHIFEVEHEMVSLRDHPFEKTKSSPRDLPPASASSGPVVVTTNGDSSAVRRRPKPYGGSKSMPRPKSEGFLDGSSHHKAGGRPCPVSMSANEYKAVQFVKGIVEKSQRGAVKVHNITSHFSQAPDSIRNTVGWTKYELEEFVKKFPSVFHVSENGDLTLNKSDRLHVIITGSRPSLQGVQTLTGRKGKIYHVAKLWGIVDLGKHEHVFFDKSIMPKDYEDLQKHFKVGETLCFNAVLAPKKSRAKWRATKVWKDTESEQADTLSSGRSADTGSESSESYESEVRQVLLRSDHDMEAQESAHAAEILEELNCPSSGGVIWNFNSPEDSGSGDDESVRSGPSRRTLAPSPDNSFMQYMLDGKAPPGYMLVPIPKVGDGGGKATKSVEDLSTGRAVQKFVSVACQTVSTGDIMATKLYSED